MNRPRTIGQIRGMAKRYAKRRAQGNDLIEPEFQEIYEAGYWRAVRDYFGTRVHAMKQGMIREPTSKRRSEQR